MKKDIAIVGMSGLLPGANNLDDFWNNLLAGRNAIKQVQKNRWSADSYFGDPKVKPNATNSIWGGFIDNVDQFDAEFFRISPKEAELMDPQQRMLAQTVWHTFEDAGIKPSSMSGSETGVFVGACNNDYSELMDEYLENIDGYLATGTFYSILANRISYLFNFHGPSLSVDTACSSSLVAMHMAAQAIKSGDCDAAIVAGVNICWTPKRFISFSSAGMLSKDGQCKTFDASANGYVRGEGVASVLLKPLDQAIADGNRIYAVVKGSAVNHGGKTKGLTVTSPQQQARLIRKAFANAQVEPESVSYIEAHGTGTSLGDPIEMLGLKIAFAAEYEEYARAASPYCAVGSVKTNIGHLEAAAGIAGIIKTALALKHRKIPSSLNLVEQNPLLKIEGSPFYINTQTRDWLAPKKSSQQHWPRRGGVSSFGFGGAYAHVVLEEIEQDTEADESLAPNREYLFVFSAKNEDALIRVLNRYQHWLDQRVSGTRPDDLAWSLFHHREHMEQRLAVIANSIDEMRKLIDAYLSGKHEPGVYQGRLSRRRKVQDDREAANHQATAESVAARWVSGDWNGELPGLSERRMISLPLYHFEPASHWFPQSAAQQDHQPPSENTVEPNMLSAENADTRGPGSGFKYFDSRKEYAADHVIDDRCVMPGATYLEMVLANLDPQYRTSANAIRLSGVSWLAPLYLDGSQIRADIEYRAKGDGQICEIRSTQGQTLHMQADVNIVVDSVSDAGRRPLDITAGLANRIDQQTAYESFKTIGFNYGPEFQPIQQIHYSDETVVAELALPASLEKQHHRYRMHPSLVDGAFQSVLVLIRQQLDSRSARLMPISLDEVIVHHALPVRCWVYGKWSKPYREGAQLCSFDIDIIDQAGLVLASFKRFAIRLLNLSLAESRSPTPMLKDVNTDMNLNAINIAENLLRQLLSDVTKLAAEKLHPNEPFENFGVDSLMINSLNRELEKHFGELSRTLFFEYLTIGELAEYLAQDFADALMSMSGQMAAETIVENSIMMTTFSSAQTVAVNAGDENDHGRVAEENYNDDDIAIIGLAGRYPMAKNIAENLLRQLLSDVTKLAAEKLHPNEPFENFGVDSLMINSLNRELEKHFGELSRTLFFEYLTIGELAEYLAQDFADALMSMSGQMAAETIVENSIMMTTFSSAQTVAVNAGDENDHGRVAEENYNDDDIAIIGLAGRYPMAKNLEVFWNNLQQGMNCITEIPPERWSFGNVFDVEKRVPGRTYSKWGGFLDDVDCFDPLFFKISPREAELLDPQERLFLECAWHTMEDAGYTRDKLGTRVGVYAGVMWGQYELYGVGQPVEGQGVPGSSYSSIANRVSYTFDFNGPSIAIDTMCSSSLTAIHLACQSIREGDIDYAFAGGVNVSSHPNKYLQLSQARYMSSEGLCRSFGEGGDGYVPGEGVGIVLLKSLQKAIADNDNIYAVIKASTLNHGGHVNGYTVPNPKAQGSLIKEALQRARWAPESISYIEAHGSGTPLGDPIEISGLNRAFSEGNAAPGSCAIGSVKSNIGHLESAAGIAGLTKVLLQMKHRRLVPSIHTDRLNRDLRLDDTPFYVQTQLSEWRAPRSANGAVLPLRAGVSSFGAGGSNAHLLVEEFPIDHVKRHETSPGQWWIVPVSAGNESALQKQVDNLASTLSEVQSRPELTLENIASTLQSGREHQLCRLAFVVDNLASLSAAMHAYLNGEHADLRWFEVLPEDLDGAVSRGRVQDAIDLRSADIGRIRAAAESWARGIGLDWNAAGYHGRSISIPGYPFERRRCWVKPLIPASMEALPLHPMLDRNQSTFRQQRFYKKLSFNDKVVFDHRINGQCMLPGAAVIEMAYAAARLSGIQQVGAVQNIAWLNPLIVVDSREIFLSLDEEQDIHFELASGDDDNKVVHACGSIKPGVALGVANIDIEAIEKRCVKEVSGEEHYAGLANFGFEYGDTLRSVKRVKVADNELLAQLSVQSGAGGYDHWSLNPALIDGALQCISHLLEQSEVPFTCDSVSIFEAPGDTCLVWVKRNSVSGFDMVIAGHDGRVLVAIEGLSSISQKKDTMNADLPHLYTPFWERVSEQQMSEQPAHRLVVFEHVFEDVLLPQANGLAEVIRVRLDHQGELSHYADNLYRVNPAYMQSCAELIKQLAEENRTPDTLVICSKSAMHSNAESVEEALNASMHAVSGIALALINARVKSPVRILFVYPEDITAIDHGIGASYPAVTGLAATIGAEHPNINVSLIEVSKQTFADRVQLGETVLREIAVRRLPGERIRESDRGQNVLRMRKIDRVDVKPVSLRSDGVYVITGGNGSLGRVFATYLASKNAGKIVLTGRRHIDSVDLSVMEPYRERIQYREVDVCDEGSLATVLEDLRAQYGKINGIIHCAGVVRDAYLMRKTPKQIDQVVSPKVLGTINLDRLTAQDELDFFHLFSSVSSRIGNPGQTDYAYANGFMDNFAEWRAGQVKNGQRHGQSCAIGWSLWRDGGMQINESMEKLLEERFGVRPLETDRGIRAWEAACHMGVAQIVVVEGDAEKIAMSIHVGKAALPDHKAAMVVVPNQQTVIVKAASLVDAPEHTRAQLIRMLQELMVDIFKLQAYELKENVSFDNFGMDSVAALNIIGEMEKLFGKLPKTLLYEYPDLASLAGYLMQSHGEKIGTMLTPPPAAEKKSDNSFDAVAAYLTGLVAQTTGTTMQDISLYTPVESYGMDSIKIQKLVSRLELDIGALPKTLLFEYPTVEKLARYVVDNHASKLSFISVLPAQDTGQESRAIKSSGIEQKIDEPIANDVRLMYEPIAIIGISGRYPGADHLDEFWDNIAGGVDSISEVPEVRWNSSGIFSAEKVKADKTYSKWGGFLSDVDCFDPLFFRISPREARKMDPQERLFLECAWHTLENANYTRQQLKDSNVGVFVGVMWSEYQLYSHSKKPDDPYPSASFSSIANRVSYSFDFRGPSLAVDTMCSSSLTAIHLACNSLRSGVCDYALAGGVNLNLHPNKYLLLSDSRFLSSDGRCRAFGEGGDGYVPGEGVGAVLLKPLSKAVQDGDPVYAVIHGTAVNHGGNATGYSVPNPEAQAKVVESALKQSGWSASSIDYIEAHGTGTSLGDPIEIAGLGRALLGINPLDKKPIGSVKSNIGHLEAAAGIAGLTKIVLQMHHGKIAPSLHAEKTNPYIEFDNSGLFVPCELQQWEPTNGRVRRAALSSFGAGGSNAHLLIEDYAYGNAVEDSQDESMLPVFVYSASDEHSLSELLRTHRDYLQKVITDDIPGFTLNVYARNLLIGREVRESRVALLASETSVLIGKLDALISNNSVVAAGIYRGNGNQTNTDVSMLNSLLDQRAWERLAEYWVNAESVIANSSVRVTHRMPCMLPVYPFARECYWIGEVELPKHSYENPSGKQALHPLIDENMSTLIEQKYQKVFTGNEFYLRDHMVCGHRVMPAAVYIEMARAASAMANPQGTLTEIINIDFSDAYIYEEEPAEIDIRLVPDQGIVRFSIESSGSIEAKSYCKGSVRYSRETVSVPRSALNIDALKARHKKVSSLDKMYDILASAGLVYGKSMRCVSNVWSGEEELVADLVLTGSSQDVSLSNMLMHPALVDSAFQLVSMFDKKAVSQYLPFSIAKIYLYGTPSERCSVVIRINDKSAANIKYFDIDFYNEEGSLLVSMQECAFRRSKTTVLKPLDDGKYLRDPLLHVEAWIETGIREKVAQGSDGVTSGVLLFVYEDDALHGNWKDRLPQNLAAKVVSVRLSNQFVKYADNAYEVTTNDEQAMASLIADVTADGQHISGVVTLLNSISPVESTNGAYVRDIGMVFLLGKLVGTREIGRPVKYIHLRIGDNEQRRCHMIAGMSRSMHAENKQAAFSIVGMDRDPGQALPEICAQELLECHSVNEIAYQNGKRYSRSFKAATEINENQTPPLYDGACVITGGLGGLGYMVATHLAGKANSGHSVKLVLLGRSKHGERESHLLEKLQQQGADVIYIEMDVADAQQAAAAVAATQQRFGKISSIYHCAGITDDKLIRNKNMEDVLRVTSPKINGIANLDRLTLNEPLQHVVLFSSLSTIVATPGQADYAAANGFLDSFADARQALVDKGLRNGKTVSIAWPLWKDGGARVTADVEAWMETSLAMSPLSEDRGMTLLFSALHGKASKFAVLANSGEQSIPDLKAS